MMKWIAISLCMSCINMTGEQGVQAAEMKTITVHTSLENDYAKLVIGPDARLLHFIGKQTGQDYARPEGALARVKIAGRDYDATSASHEDGRLSLAFGDSAATAVLGIRPQKDYFIVQVLSVRGEDVGEFTFWDMQLALEGKPEEPLAACALALNLQTNVTELPGANSRLRASCHSRFGFEGARVALIGCPREELRNVMKEVVSEAPDLPHSPVGGPWALEGPLNRSSYVFNFGGLSEQTVDEWIARAQSLGFNQIQFHGGSSFRFGDCQLDPATYPNGLASMRAVIDRLHEAGLCAGMQPYAFFIDKRCPWVTPKPDPRLAKDASFTLAEALSVDDTTVPVVESTEAMSTITGFFVRNSVTLQIDEELITYSGLAREPPYAFTGCQRGAYGTEVAAHEQGATAHHLKECFGLFVPDPDSSLLAEVAAKNAQLFNECDFDCIYLDALDGEDVLGGAENAWHYGSKYVFELWKRLEKPAVMEMSTFHHHLWFVRSRMGAWDHPTRSHKQFIDMHVAANEDNERMLLPSNLGWWAFQTWSGPQAEPTFPDDIEYLCAKAMGTDSGLSMAGYDPGAPGHQRLAAIVKRYEALRQANTVPESVKAKLRVPGSEFTLTEGPEGGSQFRRVRYDRHRVEGIDGWSNVWQTRNEFGPQPAALRIEALMAAGPYDAPGNVTLADFADPQVFTDRSANAGVTVDLQPSTDRVRVGEVSGCLTAASTLPERTASWAKLGRVFAPTLDLSGHQALGVWVHGDGQGEVLNFQVTSPQHVSGGIGEHYVVVDFTGWRYFELIEPDAGRYADYSWPYGWSYAIYREFVSFGAIESLALWCNNLPPNGQITCYLSPVKALPLAETKLINPTVTIGAKTITFPVEIESGSYLEFRSTTDCKLYGPQGELIREVEPQGGTPVLAAGGNLVTFTCGAPAGVSPRAQVTVITQGEALQ